MKRVLLDTNAFSGLMKGNLEIQKLLEEADRVYLSVVVMGELFTGFKLGSQEKRNRELLSRFTNQPTVEVLAVTEETAEIFAELKAQLQRNGTPIPLNDIWLAAQALETGAVLATFDQHFSRIAGLRIWPSLA